MDPLHTGARSWCQSCGRTIEYNGEHWVHLDVNPRHPAFPRLDAIEDQVATLQRERDEARAAVAQERERCAAIADAIAAEEHGLQRQAIRERNYERANECGAAASIAEGIARRIRQLA